MQIRLKAKHRETFDVVLGAVIGPRQRPEAVVVGLPDEGGLRIVGRSTPLRPHEARQLGEHLRPPAGEHPWPEVVSPGAVDRFNAGRDPVQLTLVEHGAAVRHLLTEHRETEDPGFYPLVFGGFRRLERRVEWPAPVPRSGPWRGLVYAKLRLLSRAAENANRDGVGVPRVGEGLVSEMTLLQEIRSTFPDEQVVHQSRPGWLVPQSLDIHFPNRDVAIEYQGIQHTRPVERFGGEAAFAVQQERDARKRAACNAVGCTLIEVHPGYNLDEVVATVRAAIEQAGA